MMKLMIPAVRRPGMTHDEFVRYVVYVHGPLLLSVPDVVADIRHYHYDFPIADAHDPLLAHDLATDVDGLTQIWFDDRAAMLRNISTRGYRDKIRPDEENFADASRVVPHLTQEKGLLGSLSSKFKLFHFRRRSPSMSRADFQAAWLEGMINLIKPHVGQGFRVVGYVQNHALPESEHRDGTNEKYFDVVDEYAVDDLSALAAGSALVENIRRLEVQFTAAARTLAFITATRETLP